MNVSPVPATMGPLASIRSIRTIAFVPSASVDPLVQATSIRANSTQLPTRPSAVRTVPVSLSTPPRQETITFVSAILVTKARTVNKPSHCASSTIPALIMRCASTVAIAISPASVRKLSQEHTANSFWTLVYKAQSQILATRELASTALATGTISRVCVLTRTRATTAKRSLILVCQVPVKQIKDSVRASTIRMEPTATIASVRPATPANFAKACKTTAPARHVEIMELV